MSININWEDATSGPDGEALAERIRSFIHDKFQQIALPRFIRSVEVTSFDLGSVPPELDIRDLSDPFADFYEADEDDDELSDGGDEEAAPAATGGREGAQGVREGRSARDGEKWPAGPSGTLTQEINGGFHPLSMQHAFNHQHTVAPTRLGSPIGDPLNTYRFFPRPGTSGILGGTSNNMRYYHMPLGGLSGTSTPLAAVAGGGGGGGGAKGGTSPTSPDASPTPEQQEREQHAYCLSEAEDEVFQQRRAQGRNPSGQDVDAVSGRNLSAQQPPQAAQGTTQSPPPMYFPNTSTSPSPHRRMRERKAEDFQVFCRVKYSGDIKLSLTAHILIDYPMPCFVGLPLKLNITGMAFGGVAVVAYIRKRVHVCFLSPEDADAFLGPEDGDVGDGDEGGGGDGNGAGDVPGRGNNKQPYLSANAAAAAAASWSSMRGDNAQQSLLRHIQVESEIGRQEDGKQVLKNVGKVEKFVVEQVRRIFDEEFVYPSFWTFLV